MKNEFYQIYRNIFGTQSKEMERMSLLFSQLFSPTHTTKKNIDFEALEYFSRITKCWKEFELTEKIIFVSFVGEFIPENYDLFHNEKKISFLKFTVNIIYSILHSIIKFFKGAFICLYLKLAKQNEK